MAEETIKISVVATGFDQVQKGLDNTSKALDNTSKSAVTAGKALGSQFNNASGQATNTLTNLSRVAQDAPYGFIGIANNINPLIESFGRLQAESGSLKGAFTSLLTSLTGPAGIGLAVGVISSLLVTFGGNLFSSKKNVDELDYSLQRTKQTLQSVKDDFENFINVADTAKGLNDINIKLRFKEEGTQNALIRQSEFITISEKYVAAVNATIAAKENYLNINEKDFKSEKDYNDAKNQAFDIFQKLGNEEVNLLNLREKQAALNRLATQEEKRLAAERLAAADSVNKTIAKLREDLKDQVMIGIAFNTTTISERVKLYESAIKKLITDFNVSPDSEIIIDLKTELNQAKVVKDLTTNAKQIETKAPEIKLPPIKTPEITGVEIKDIPFPKALIDFSDAVKGFISDIAINISTTLSDALSGAITGTSTFGDFFQNILSVLGQSVESFGKQLIKLGALALIAKLSLEQSLANPYALIAAGIALVAFGALLSQTKKQQAFAVGTNYAPGGMALVGERGPEMVSLPRGSKVTPAAQTAQIMGGAMQQVEVFGVLRGQDIYFSNKKYSQTYRRTT